MTLDAWVAVSARAVVQLLFVVVLFGVGRGIGGILGAMTWFPAALPVAISFLSIPIARMIWDPWAQSAAPPPLGDQKDPLPPEAAIAVKPATAPDASKSSPRSP